MEKNNGLEKAYKFCSLLKDETIKSEIENILMNYSLDEIEFRRNQFTCTFSGKNKNAIKLVLDNDMIHIKKCEKDFFSDVTIIINNKTLYLLRQINVEKRCGGVIFTEIKKQFSKSECFRNKSILFDLYEKRYVFKNDKALFDIYDVKNWTLMRWLYCLKSASRALGPRLEEWCDLYNCFSLHMNYYPKLEVGRKVKDNIYPTTMYLNDEEVSNVFDVNDGPDKLYRIYDLYRGIINTRNEIDINSINLGFLSADAFDFRSLKGITEQENHLVGKSTLEISNDYVDYLSKLFNNKFGYKGEIKTDRESLLKGITYKMSLSELAKRQIEKKLGIPYDEYEKLDIDEQRKLTEKKTRKKIRYDVRLYIDGVPVEEEHVITKEQIDKITDLPKRLLKKILKRKKI